ncbi:Zn(2)-C6 fungal-type DNA-binding domain protein [Cordyceps fumosorosea ARSEF 2679]|uniref:Zn(2)-C6 fungal-type DNA-binding domain protein n=1 Tax=Cordyceps fumosorosea (strain ARSEF 2679) TaxID=1081104 RepID=A0A162JJJ0_CORFA|nr:Zn(2)-C6 fungal-type DNA-binding domain protein [Cordyceps fumosorosea ARSEF 2679]OAA69902.1 Zn(2)-C6 fungal-type DNA-binding domain protein [Cordyceps fumosorosea ARSEF 2679]
MTAEMPSSRVSTATTPTSQTAEPGTSTACLPCRQRHLKCDGKRPCKRCVDSHGNCVFVPSRRGQRIQQRGGSQCIATQELESLPGIKRTHDDAGFLASDCRRKSLFRSFTPPPPASRSLVAWGKSGPTLAGSQHQFHPHPAVNFERCMSSYYRNFHASHPLALPQAKLQPLVKDDALQPLLVVMHWVGSKYVAPEAEQGPLLEIARLAVDEATETRTASGFTVQAMVVLLVALDGEGYAQQAVELLARAKEMLLALGMNYGSFARSARMRSRVLEESWRRTWWEVYVLDGMFAGAHRATTFTLFDVPTDVGLPCEEDEYESDQIPEPRTLDDLNDRDLAMDDREFSSFAYRILSVRNLGRVMRGGGEEDADALEVLLSSWRHNIPASKRDSLRRDGRVDEMAFQAHMLNHTTSILLHRPRAQLDPAPARTIDACSAATAADYHHHQQQYPHPAVNLHTRHVVDAANELGRMMTHRAPLTQRTHFFICAVVLAAVVQLGAWSDQEDKEEEEEEGAGPGAREQVRLCIGALRRMATVWGLAGRALGQVREVAGRVHLARAQSRQMEQFLVDVVADEEVLGMFAADADAATLVDMETALAEQV